MSAKSTKKYSKTHPKRSVAVWTATDENIGEFRTCDQSLLDSIQPMIKFSNFFGFLPLFLLTNHSKGQITWKRMAQVFYLVFVIFTILALGLHNFVEFFTIQMGPRCSDISCYMRQFTGISFNVCCITPALYFATFGLRRFWTIVQRWDAIGRRFTACFSTSNFVITDFNLPKKHCLIFVCVYYGAVITEHVIQDIWLLHKYVQDYNANQTTNNFFYLLYNKDPVAITILTYLPGSELWFYLGGKYKVIAWNFNDFIVINIGLCLGSSFLAFNRQLKAISSIEQWKKARKIHLELCELVDMIDELLSPVILLTLGVTIYYVANQTYFQLKSNDNHETPLRVIYGAMSIVLLAVRAGGTIMLSANVQEQGKDVLTILSNCPTHLYNVEVERFWDQAIDYPMALSGAKLFYLNRRLFLTTVSVIVTYQLVFLGLI